MNTEKLWKAVLAELELSVSKATYRTHFAASQLLSLADGVATIGFANPLMRTLVETRYYSLVKSVLDHHTNQNVSLVFAVAPRKETLSARDAGPLFSPAYEEPSISLASIAKRLHIRPDATFENFAVSTTNQMAYAAATAVARSPGTAYNPLFIYGGVGVGKTHLMQAVANAILAKRPNTRVVYCMGEEFLNELKNIIFSQSDTSNVRFDVNSFEKLTDEEIRKARLEAWQDHAPAQPYDAIISIGAFEHFARPGMSACRKPYGPTRLAGLKPRSPPDQLLPVSVAVARRRTLPSVETGARRA